jgi:hypothetical protein
VNDFTLRAGPLAAILSVVFCLDFGHFFFSSLVPLLDIFPLFIYLFIYYFKEHQNRVGVCTSAGQVRIFQRNHE